MTDFKLRLEFEEIDPGNWNIENEYCNVMVRLPNETYYAINVWTYKFFETAVSENTGEGKSYVVPPDLFVKELSRACIQETIQSLLEVGPLEQMLNPSVGPYDANIDIDDSDEENILP
ncbi:hypothetical protein [Chitinophaga dinghuensis]|uniref:hypothetical protein n=1 Tax=Chitinophaga dinghuensis TaxID=1539050 RepID=UPI000DB9B4B0|nr:hypothetical protein [Chitinophaga dinghuensis]